MSMTDWAKREVEIACKRENPNRKEGEFDYGCSCYESALKAYLSLMEDGHSGYSFEITKQILIRLMNGLPLTPIEDIPDSWNSSFTDIHGVKHYQCKRKSSLFKLIYPDGKIIYKDIERFSCYNVDDKNRKHPYYDGIAESVLDEYFPITFPYSPLDNKKYVVEMQEFLADERKGDFDTLVVRNITTPEGETFDIYRFFGEDDERNLGEIDYDEFEKRVALHRERIESENNDNSRRTEKRSNDGTRTE